MDKIKQEEVNLKKFTLQDMPVMRRYFEECPFRLSDYSAAFKVMWSDYFLQYYAIIKDCLVFAEYFRGRLYFNYPISLTGEAAEDSALDEIERRCREKGLRIHFTSVPKEKLGKLIERYGTELKVTNPRRWRDYLYNAEDFVTFKGGKYAGQRNHINKFKKLYPEWEYVTLSSADSAEIHAFLKQFEGRQLKKGTLVAREELAGVYALTDKIDELGLCAGGIRVDGRLIAFSVGEVCADTLIIHVEKALVSYEGAYTIMANEFAKHNVTGGVRFINREDDAGDEGLRKSKLQYNPVRLVDKYTVLPKRAIDGIEKLPHIRTEKTEIKEITDTEAQDFYRLEYDKERNKYWGYDWRKNCKDEPNAEYFMEGIRKDFKNKEEMPLGIFVNCKLAGEVVLHNFGYRADCEVGMRLLPEYEGNGYAAEAVRAIVRHALFEYDIEVVYAKCFKENVKSRNTLIAAGMKANGEDDVYYYFIKTAAM